MSSSRSRPTSGMATGPSVAATSGASSETGRNVRRCAAIESVLANGVVQLGRLAERRDAELAIEDRDELPVLPDRPDPIAGEGQQLDEPPVAELVERVELHATAGRLDGPGGVTGGGPGRRQPVEQRRDGTLDANGSAGLPIVERGAVTEREASQERASGESGGRLEIGRPGRGRQPLEPHEVDARGRRIQSDLRSADLETGRTDGRPERRQRPAQRPPGGLVVPVRPEHRGQLVPRERPALGRDERDDRQRLARIDDDRLTRHHDLERAEQADLQRHGAVDGHGVTVLDGHGIP